MITNIMGREFKESFRERQLAPVEAVPTPLPTWNSTCGDDGGRIGLAKGWMVIVGGNPKIGKSVMALAMAESAMRAGEMVGFVSLEMKTPALAARVMAMMTKTPVRELEKADFTSAKLDEVWDKISPEENEYDLLVDDRRMRDFDTIKATMDEMLHYGCTYFVVDYLQLASLGTEKKIHEAVGETTAHLSSFAVETDSVVVALSQFNRETSKNYQETPMPQGLHGGMIIEATADQIILFDHSRTGSSQHGQRMHMMLTNRHGRHAEIPIELDYRYLTIREANEDEEDGWVKDWDRFSK